MKTPKYIFILLHFSFALATTFAQMTIKDGDDNILLNVNDYGTTGTVTLPPFGSILPTFPINNYMLYNIDGTLYFNGAALGTSNNAGGWTDLGTKIHNSTLTDNVGIGTNNPQSRLSVGGLGTSSASISSESTSGWGIYGKSTTGRGVFGSANGTAGEGVIAEAHGQNGRAISGYASDATGYAGYFSGRGYFSGNVGIGTANPLSKLSVGGEGSTNFAVYGTNSANGGVAVYARSNAITGGTAIEAISEGQNGTSLIAQASSYGGNGVEAFAHGTDGRAIYGSALGTNGKAIVGNGKAYDFDATGTGINYGSTSSRRWKNNIVEIDNPLEKLSQIRGVYFDWDEEHGGLRDVGMIAEEVGKVLPEIVVYEENGIDADGMDYSKLTPLLVEIAKTQQKQIEELKNEVKELKQEIEKYLQVRVSK